MRATRIGTKKAGVWALALLICWSTVAFPYFSPDGPRWPIDDRVRLAEAFRIAWKYKNKLWEGWSKAPFAVLLVTPTGEFLVRHSRPSDDFEPFIYDTLLKAGILYRPARFPQNLVATLPAVNGIATIVIGQPEKVFKSSGAWVMALLHEHFHQLQMSQPDYFAAVESLGLTGDDKTGRWMLDYPFPYDSVQVKEAFAELGRLLLDGLRAPERELTLKVLAYLEAHKRFQELLSPNEYKYFSFQLWQEGVARYTECRMAELVAGAYKPTERFRALLDFTSFRVVADSIKGDILAGLSGLDLQRQRRIAFYYIGAGEALLLDRVNPSWQKQYFKNKFFLEKYF